MGLKDRYYIETVDYKIAMKMIIENHYLHRKSSCSFAFGLYEKENDRLVGVITYGLPASPRVCEGICGKNERNNVYELTRLWIEDSTPKNAESFLIGNTIGLLDKEIIISYSEIQQGHVGTVYQATNFIYVGLTEKRTNRVKADGSTTKHNRHACKDKEDTILVQRPRKHRYVIFNANKKRKKELKSMLKYKIQSYPKS